MGLTQKQKEIMEEILTPMTEFLNWWDKITDKYPGLQSLADADNFGGFYQDIEYVRDQIKEGLTRPDLKEEYWKELLGED